MRRRLWMTAMIGGVLAWTAARPARAGDDPAQRVAISAEELAAVRAWLPQAAASPPRALRTAVSSTTAPDWLVAHAGPASPPPVLDPAQLQRGERLPVTVYRLGEPLPPEVLAHLPAQPRGTMLLRFEHRLVRVFRPTRTVLDVAEL